MREIQRIKGACAPTALHHVSGIDEDTVLRICALRNFVPAQGMWTKDWLEAADDLGIKKRKVSMEPCRLSTFIKKHPKGLFLCETYNHLFVVDNSVIVDPREKLRGNYPGLGRIIQSAWRCTPKKI